MTISARMRRVVSVMAGLALVVANADVAGAHPLGNFTVNTAAQVVIGTDEVLVGYAIDLAEIPTLQTGADADGDGTIDRSEALAQSQISCADAADRFEVTVDGQPVALVVVSTDGRSMPGSADLSTLRFDCAFRGERTLNGSSTQAIDVEVRDGFGAQSLGWHEVTIGGDRMTVAESTVPSSSPSDGLRSYPVGVETLDTTEAIASLSPGGDVFEDTGARGPLRSPVPGVDGLADRLIGSGEVSLGSGMVLVLTATLLGAMHAFAPGHGKTVMAAYLLGERRGSVRQALTLGATVTVTHTIGVLVLGAAISLSTLAAPDRIYPWLGIVSGLLVAGIGANLIRLAIRSRRSGGLLHLGHHHGDLGRGHHEHGHHEHGHHEHGHHEHGHHEPAHHSHANDHDHSVPGRLRLGSVVAMGFAGGLVPSPSALVVLLGSVALGRTGFGIAMVAAYGFGMALTLVSAGLIFVLLRERASRFLTADPGAPLRAMLRWAPMVTATAVVGGGVLIAARAAAQF